MPKRSARVSADTLECLSCEIKVRLAGISSLIVVSACWIILAERCERSSLIWIRKGFTDWRRATSEVGSKRAVAVDLTSQVGWCPSCVWMACNWTVVGSQGRCEVIEM